MTTAQRTAQPDGHRVATDAPVSMCMQPRQDGWFRMALRPAQQWLLPTALACLLFPAVNALTAVTQVSCMF